MKNYIKIFVIQLLFISICFGSNKQQTAFLGARITFDKQTGVPTNIIFKDFNKPTPESFFQIYRSIYNLSTENKLNEFSSHTDNLGHTHHRFKQYYKGLELAEVQYLLHEQEGLVHHAHGKLIHGLEINIKHALHEASAIQFALNHINASQYVWEHPLFNTMYKKSYPKGKLMISSGDKEMLAENFRLVYRFKIYTAIPFGGYAVDVDANSGEIIGKLPLVYDDDVQGYGQSNYNGLVPITVKKLIPYSHLNYWNAYGGSGQSWWFADTLLGNEGGYDNDWYQVLDTDPITLTGENLTLSFYHRYSTEVYNDSLSYEDYDAWDGMNVRISLDSGFTWQVLENPVPEYPDKNISSFGFIYKEGKGIPGWSGAKHEWSQVTFDLKSFVNEIVQFRFAFASDSYGSSRDFLPELYGWQIDEISISNSTEVLFSNNGTEAGFTPKNIVGERTNAKYSLRDYSRGKGIYTLNTIFDEYNNIYVEEISDKDSLFVDDEDKAGVSVHWATESTYDYYLDKFGRDSYDGNGSPIESLVNWDFPNNAMWTGSFAAYGKGDGLKFNPWVSLDIVGHEITHGVTQNSAGLIYANESGALNESFSDIFGTAVEFYMEGEIGDWHIFEDIKIEGYHRSLQNPKSRNDPDTYKGINWEQDQDEDNGGVHTNSGVQNHWFYLLSEGGSGINDNRDVYSVNGVGIEDAEQIAYRNLTVYLMPSSQYADARLGSIHATIDLFGLNSPQYQAVLDAWYAVGVNIPFVGPYAEKCFVDNAYKNPGVDSLIITTKINNPNNHNLTVKALIENFAQSFADTITLYDDGLHQDSIASDKYYGGLYSVLEEESFYNIHVATSSADSGYNNISRSLARYTTAGPIVIDSFLLEPFMGSMNKLKLYLKNVGNTMTVSDITVKLATLDTNNVSKISTGTVAVDIIAGESVEMGNVYITINGSPDTILFNLNIYSDGYDFWQDSLLIDLTPTDVEHDDENIPKVFALEQNYPNPFNPSTTIKYEIPGQARNDNVHVQLRVYDILGREVAVLVNGQRKPGYYEVNWNANNNSSGVYFCRIRAGGFVDVKKMILLR